MAQTINSKAGATLLGGAVATLAIGLFSRYTSYDPNAMEASAITTLSAFACAWFIPETWWRKSQGVVDEAPPAE